MNNTNPQNEARELLQRAALSVWEQQAGLAVTADAKSVAADWRGSDCATIARAMQRVNAPAGVQATASPLLDFDFVRLAGIAVETGMAGAWEKQLANFAWMRGLGLPDFRENSLLTIAPDGFLEVAEGNPILPGLPAVTKESAYLKTYARLYKIGERLFEADQSGVFIRLGQQFALSAAAKQADIAYGVLIENPALADGQPWLSVDAGNQAPTGQNYSTPLTEQNLDNALAGLRAQRLNGLRLNLSARYLLVGADEELASRRLVRDLVTAGELTVIVEDRLTGHGFYLIADPEIMPTVARLSLAASKHPVDITASRSGAAMALEIRASADMGAAPMSRVGIYWTPRQ